MTVFGRILDKVLGRANPPPSPQSLDFTFRSPSKAARSPPSTPLGPYPLGHRPPSRPHSIIVGEYINVVGHDQTNVINHIHMNTDVSGGKPLIQSAPSQSSQPYSVTTDVILFNKLSHVAEASFDASTPALRRACTENTRTAILEAITKWSMDPTEPKIYWLNGMAGTGKTTIAYSLSIILTNLNILGATFFCSRLVDECTKVDRIFPTIAYHLARKYPPLSSAILEALKTNPDVAKKTIYHQFTDLIVKPMKAAANDLFGQNIVVIIDALDECANQAEVQTFLSVIFQRSFELPFKIFITSRPEQLVRVSFNRQTPDSYSKLILHDIERDIVNADIELYVAERLVEMVDGRSDFQESKEDWPPKDKVDVLVRRANRLFIYAKTVCDYIGEPGGNISGRLSAAVLSRVESDELGQVSGNALDTSELDRLYRDILDKAIPKRTDERTQLKKIVSAVISIRNPLSARGLGTLLEIDPRTIKSSLASLHSVISVPQSLDAPVSTFHASFPDCLTESTRSHQYFLPPSESHQMLAKSGLSLMNSSLKENICELDGRPSNNDIPKEIISTRISEGLAYACVYWTSHFTASGKESLRVADDVRNLLNEFLRDHVLHWMECLSLLGRLDIAIESLRAMEGWLSDIYPETLPMITDARRFVLENFEVIRDYCLETYHSALVWLPTQSVIRKHYALQKPELPKVLVGLRHTYGYCEKIMLCRSEVYSVAYSSDGCHVVSGSSDSIVRIWNAVTGEVQVICKGHSRSVSSVAFSSNDRHVVSGSFDRTVRIWDALTGESEGVFEGHSGYVTSVAFSSDGSHIVSGSYDSTVRVWDAVSGVSKGVFKGHSSYVSSVAFSNDSRRVVSGSFDMTIRIWNVTTGESEIVFEGHSGYVSSVAFSCDGIYIASGSYDSTARIWNVATGESETAFEGHSDEVTSVTFSRDGHLVVSGSYDKTVQIWDAMTGKPKRVLKGHSRMVSSVAISSDGSHVASGSDGTTVRIWNAVTGESEGIFDGYSGGVSSVAFSSDGRRVASGSCDKTVKVWNAVTGESEGIFEGHSARVTSVGFSSDGHHVVSGSDDNTVRIWDVATGALVYVLGGESVASSPSLRQRVITVHFALELPASYPTTILGFEPTLLSEAVGFPNDIVTFVAIVALD